MGCYDYIDLEVPCPLCGKMVNGWQTKDVENCFFTYGRGSHVSRQLKYITGLADCTHRIAVVGDGFATVVVWIDLIVHLDENGCIPKENVRFEVVPEVQATNCMYGGLIDDKTPEEFNAEMEKLEVAIAPKIAEQMAEKLQESIWKEAARQDPDVRIADEIHWDYHFANLRNWDVLELEIWRKGQREQYN